MQWVESGEPDTELYGPITYKAQRKITTRNCWCKEAGIWWNLTQFWWFRASIDWPGFRLRIGPLFIIWWWNKVQYGLNKNGACVYLRSLPGDEEAWTIKDGHLKRKLACC